VVAADFVDVDEGPDCRYGAFRHIGDENLETPRRLPLLSDIIERSSARIAANIVTPLWSEAPGNAEHIVNVVEIS
jgi:hypothetical protein